MQTVQENKTIRIYESNVRELLEKWAWWRRAGRLGAEVAWPKKTLTGKFLDGMPGVNCPTCCGQGRIPVAQFRITRAMIACPTCEGEGRIKLDKTDPDKINPAFVRTTRRYNEDEVLVVVDRLVCSLRQNSKTAKYYFVLWAEYVSHKYERQDEKADRLGLSHSYFRKLLHDAHVIMEHGLFASHIAFGDER